MSMADGFPKALFFSVTICGKKKHRLLEITGITGQAHNPASYEEQRACLFRVDSIISRRFKICSKNICKFYFVFINFKHSIRLRWGKYAEKGFGGKQRVTPQ